MGLFSKIKLGLQKTRNSIASGVTSIINSFTKIDEELFEELEEILVMYDIGVETSVAICDRLRQYVKKNGVTDPKLIKEYMHDVIVEMFLSDVGSIFIIDDDENLCGVVSRKDLLKATIGGFDINKMPIGMIMTRTPNVVTVKKQDSIILAARKIIEHEVDSIPVVEVDDDNKTKVLGRISKTNITKLFLEIAGD